MSDDFGQSDLTVPVRQALGAILFGETVGTPGQTLQTIALMRDALAYLESRYARQIAEAKAARERAAEDTPPVRKAAAKKEGPKRGRPRTNGAASQRAEPAGLPFNATEQPPAAAEV